MVLHAHNIGLGIGAGLSAGLAGHRRVDVPGGENVGRHGFEGLILSAEGEKVGVVVCGG